MGRQSFLNNMQVLGRGQGALQQSRGLGSKPAHPVMQFQRAGAVFFCLQGIWGPAGGLSVEQTTTELAPNVFYRAPEQAAFSVPGLWHEKKLQSNPKPSRVGLLLPGLTAGQRLKCGQIKEQCGAHKKHIPDICARKAKKKF